MAELVAKWSFAGHRWHWCFSYVGRGPTLCGIKKMMSIGACIPGPRNWRHRCKRCAKRKAARRG